VARRLQRHSIRVIRAAGRDPSDEPSHQEPDREKDNPRLSALTWQTAASAGSRGRFACQEFGWRIRAGLMTVRRGRGMLPVSAATSIGLAPLERVQRREAGASCRRRQVSLEHPPGLLHPEDVVLGARPSNVRCCPCRRRRRSGPPGDNDPRCSTRASRHRRPTTASIGTTRRVFDHPCGGACWCGNSLLEPCSVG
jgi:hypothetical protein